MSTKQMLAAEMKGKGSAVLHAHLAHLWEYGDQSSPPTSAPLVTDCAAEESAGDEEELQGKEPGSSCCPEPEQQVDIRDFSLKDRDTGPELGADLQNQLRMPVQRSSRRLRTAGPQERKCIHGLISAFFHALKCQVKKSDLPQLTSIFRDSHMVPYCLAGKQLDINQAYKEVL